MPQNNPLAAVMGAFIYDQSRASEARNRAEMRIKRHRSNVPEAVETTFHQEC